MDWIGKRLTLVVLFCGSAWGQSSTDLQKVLGQLNSAAAKFQSAQADFSWDQLTASVQDHDVQTGTIYYQRKKSFTQMALDIKQENGQDAPKTVLYDGVELRLYQPAIKQLTRLKSGANRAQFESFLTLGFGGSGSDLETNWTVSFLGSESIDGVAVAKLDLVPKEKSVATNFSHVTIWVDPTRSVSYKQVLYEPSGDSRTAIYKKIRYNSPIAADVFELKVPPDANVVVK